MTEVKTATAVDERSAYDIEMAQDGRDPALLAEGAINDAIAAVAQDDAPKVRERVEFAKYVLMSHRCGMKFDDKDLMGIMRSPGLALCSGLSNVSEMASRGILTGTTSILAEAAMRARALVA